MVERRWVEIAVTIAPEAAEAVADALRATGARGVAEIVAGGLVTLTAYVLAGATADAQVAEVRARLEQIRDSGVDVGPGALSAREIGEEDWASAWKAFFRPTAVAGAGLAEPTTDRLIIKPTEWPLATRPDQAVVEIDPGAAFGTGDHPTTRACLSALVDLARPGVTVLDMGSGSGILAIAAAKLGAERVWAVEDDPWAVETARANIDRNGVVGQVTLIEAAAIPGDLPLVDVIVANIDAETIKRLAPMLASHLCDTGWAILAGIMAEQAPSVADAVAAAGLTISKRWVDGEWVAFAARREKTR
jgi:ribosomal protein L11 methyltransferase